MIAQRLHHASFPVSDLARSMDFYGRVLGLVQIERPPLPFPTVLHPIRVMEAEHARLADGVEELTRLTGGFAVPEGAPDALRRLLEELKRFCSHLTDHLREENDVLFPRALAVA